MIFGDGFWRRKSFERINWAVTIRFNTPIKPIWFGSISMIRSVQYKHQTPSSSSSSSRVYRFTSSSPKFDLFRNPPPWKPSRNSTSDLSRSRSSSATTVRRSPLHLPPFHSDHPNQLLFAPSKPHRRQTNASIHLSLKL